MNGWVGWLGMWVNGWLEEWMDEQTDGWADRQINIHIYYLSNF